MATRFALVLALLLPLPLAGAPALVEDLYPGTATEPVGRPLLWSGLQAGGRTYFQGEDPVHGNELWRTDGTAAGTERLTDLCPGPCGSNPNAVVLPSGRIVMAATDGSSGNEPWASDGVPGSEEPLGDLCPGPCDSNPSQLMVVGDRVLFFSGDYFSPETAIYRTDGTPGGTERLKTVCSSCTVLDPVRIGNRILWRTADDIWVSDGTVEGTRPVGISPAPEIFGSLFPLGDAALFWTPAGLWRTDGTAAGTSLVKAAGELLAASDNPSVPFGGLISGGVLYLPMSSRELLRSDGTPAGTWRFAQFDEARLPGQFIELAGRILFVVHDFNRQSFVLWETAGTAESTREVEDLPGNDFLSGLVPAGRFAYFTQRPPDSTDVDLWVTDGTFGGSGKLIHGLDASCQSGMVAAGDQLLFCHSGGGLGQRALWHSDGTLSGTQPLHPFGKGPGSGEPQTRTVLGPALLFSARVSPDRSPLFRSDGTAAGTGLLSDAPLWADDFTPVGKRVFFTASSDEPYDYARQLWVSDGTPSGTTAAAPAVGGVHNLSPLGNGVLFAATKFFLFGDETELWKSDGRRAGTGQLVDINRYTAEGRHHACIPASSSPSRGVQVGNRVFFAANDGRFGVELWVSDGTAAGTRMVRDINPRRVPGSHWGVTDCTNLGPFNTGLGSFPEDLLPLRGGVLLTADDGLHGRELWFSDGTAEGTRRISDLEPGTAGAYLRELVPFHGKVYFLLRKNDLGDSLWQTDGTARGTRRVRDLAFAGHPTWASRLTAAGDQLFFTADNEETGPELWVSGGDGPSTRLVADLRPGPRGSYPQSLAAATAADGSRLLFAADDGISGLEPWTSDGTATGTHPLFDLNPGPEPSSPSPFTRVGASFLTGADDGVSGRELWAIPAAEVR